jgi:hypothetical protein
MFLHSLTSLKDECKSEFRSQLTFLVSGGRSPLYHRRDLDTVRCTRVSLRQRASFAMRFTHSSALDAAQISSNSSITTSIDSFLETMITPEL